MAISLRKGRKLIRRQIVRDTAHALTAGVAGKLIGGTIGHIAAKRFGATAALSRLGARFGQMGERVAAFGPAALGATIGSTVIGATATPRIYRENKMLAERLGLPPETVTPLRAASPWPAAFAVRKAFRKAHPRMWRWCGVAEVGKMGVSTQALTRAAGLRRGARFPLSMQTAIKEAEHMKKAYPAKAAATAAKLRRAQFLKRK